MYRRVLPAIGTILCLTASASLPAQSTSVPTVRFTSAPAMSLPVESDSNVPMTWTRIDGVDTLVAFASWGGVPRRLAGPDLERLKLTGDVTLSPHPGGGIWIESVIHDEAERAWYAYYPREVPASACGRPDRMLASIGAARSTDRGVSWTNLGIIIDAPPGSEACGSLNRYTIGGVGDLTAMVDSSWRDVYFFFSGYAENPAAQGVAVARLAWADRDRPQGRVAIWNQGAWLPPVRRHSRALEYPAGTPLVMPSKPWHDANLSVDAFWGPSVHWNTYLERYVMLLNRARDEQYNNEGIYVSYAPTLDDPRAWTVPHKIMNGGGWYPQIAGSERGSGSDKQMGQRARFFLTGRSTSLLEFRR